MDGNVLFSFWLNNKECSEILKSQMYVNIRKMELWVKLKFEYLSIDGKSGELKIFRILVFHKFFPHISHFSEFTNKMLQNSNQVCFQV